MEKIAERVIDGYLFVLFCVGDFAKYVYDNLVYEDDHLPAVVRIITPKGKKIEFLSEFYFEKTDYSRSFHRECPEELNPEEFEARVSLFIEKNVNPFLTEIKNSFLKGVRVYNVRGEFIVEIGSARFWFNQSGNLLDAENVEEIVSIDENGNLVQKDYSKARKKIDKFYELQVKLSPGAKVVTKSGEGIIVRFSLDQDRVFVSFSKHDILSFNPEEVTLKEIVTV